MSEIYIVMYSFYSDWQIYGYFTDKATAEKWIALHGDHMTIHKVSCLDNTVDYRNVELKYEHEVVFDHKPEGWVIRPEPERYNVYIADYLHSNKINSTYYKTNKWVSIKINTLDNDRDKVEKIAQDLLYQYLDTCYGTPVESATQAMNMMLSEKERTRESITKLKKEKAKLEAALEELNIKWEDLNN